MSAAVVATTNALAAAGGLVRLAPEEFMTIVHRADNPLVVHARTWTLFLTKGMHQYLTSYRGINFVTTTRDELGLPKGTELIQATTMFLPV